MLHFLLLLLVVLLVAAVKLSLALVRYSQLQELTMTTEAMMLHSVSKGWLSACLHHDSATGSLPLVDSIASAVLETGD